MMEDDIAEMGEEVQNTTREEKKRLYERVEELKRSNALILAENDLFERFISRLDPKELLPQDAAETLGGLRVSQLEVLNRGRKQRTRSSTPDRMQQLTIEQKCSVARREVVDTRSDLETLKHSSERTLEHYRAILEEAQVRLTETRKDTYEFERDAAKPLRENKEEMMAAEKVLRYLLDKMKTKDNQVEKLRLKNQALRTQSRKLQVQLRQRRETEEDLNEAEFQHQTIRNREHVGKIDESNKELLRLKLLSGSTQQLTSNKQKKLQSVTCESQQLSNDIANRKDLLLKIEAETAQVQEELSTAERLNQKLCSQLAEYSVPGVLQYMQVKDRHNKLQSSLRTWERKMELAEMTMKTSSKSWNHQRISAAAAATKAEAFQPSVNLPNIVSTTTMST